MKFKKTTADVFVPDETDLEQALKRTTHLAIGAHQDDLEIFAYHGIAECYRSNDKHFTGVTVTDGSSSSRTGRYKDYTNQEMVDVRKLEQRKAAYTGEYSVQFQLDYPSAEIKDVNNDDSVDDLLQILSLAKPEVLYLHNPADKHETHIAVLMKCLSAIRKLPLEDRPKVTYGCEVWRDLDWLVDSDKIHLDNSDMPNMASSLVGLFDSQISGGKRYDLATDGRRLANATYFDSHSSDDVTALNWAIDLTPVIMNDELSLKDFTLAYVDRFRNDVASHLDKYSK